MAHTIWTYTRNICIWSIYNSNSRKYIIPFSTTYTTKGDPSSLEYLEYDKLGTKASAGCIRLTVQDAAWIYNNITTGTIVEFYYDSNPGPLGKPGAAKISGNTVCRGWDPTDSNPNNPWKNKNNTSAPAQNPTPSQNNKTNNNTEQNKNENQEGKQEETKKDNGNKQEDNKKNNINPNDAETNKTENKTNLSNEIKNNLSNNIKGNTTNTITNKLK